MKKILLPITLAALFLFSEGCQPTEDVSPKDDATTDKGARISSTTTSTGCDVVSFNKVAAGTLLSQITSDGGLVIPMTSFNSRSPEKSVAAITFNSLAPHPEDVDLGTPNKAFGGPGVGAGGASGTYVNNTSLGNIAVIQNFKDYGTTPNDDDVPGYITFNFSSISGGITATSLTVIDVEKTAENESGNVKLYSSKGGTLLYTAQFPNTGANGVGIINLNNTSNVGYIEVNINGSIGIDNLRFCKPPRTTNQCSYTQGYWKTHGPNPKGNNKNEWDVTSLKLGNVTYSDKQLIQIFWTPVSGNGLINLAHQLIAAKLNIANGTNDSTIKSTIAEADKLIGSKVIPPIGNGYLSPSSVSSLVDKLTKYNEGKLAGGPSHCN